MSNGYIVDHVALADMAGVLMGLAEEFAGVEDAIDGYRDDVGHGGLSGAINKWSENWSEDRDKLLEKLENVAGFAAQAAACYADTEAAICEGLVVEDTATAPLNGPVVTIDTNVGAGTSSPGSTIPSGGTP